MKEISNYIKSIIGNRKNKGRSRLTVLILIISLLLATGCSQEEAEEKDLREDEKLEASEEIEIQDEVEELKKERDLKVHYIDVGQGDAIFIELPNGENILIDGGPGSAKDGFIAYLRGLDFDRIDHLVATHPHEDHIGGLPEVIRSFDIGEIYMPDVIHTTKIFEELITEIGNKDYSINPTETGTILVDEAGLSLKALAPDASTSSSNLNDYSIVLRLDYQDTSFMFTGDGEQMTEQYLLADNSGEELKVDVLKLGHHGSDTSSIQPFIDTVNPDHAVITCGVDNKYGHPSPQVLERLKTGNIDIHRTDTQGTIVITSDGEKIEVTKEGSTIKENKLYEKTKKETKEETKEEIKEETKEMVEVYITKTGSKYHKKAHGNGKFISTTLDDAKARGLEACKVCY